MQGECNGIVTLGQSWIYASESLACAYWSSWSTETVTISQREALLERLRTQRKLPSADERKRIRKAAGVSIRQLAEAMGVSPMAPVRWEQGAMPRNPDTSASTPTS